MFSLETHRLVPEAELTKREAYLRAALAEYASMDDGLCWDTKPNAPSQDEAIS